MPTSVVPALLDALVTQTRAALPAVTVLDGPEVTGIAPGLFLLIGVDDLEAESGGFAVEARQEWANANGTARDESGDITCTALGWNGDGDQKAARDAVYGAVDALADLLRANPALDVDGLLWTSFGSMSQLTQAQGDTGAIAQLTFRINYRARL